MQFRNRKTLILMLMAVFLVHTAIAPAWSMDDPMREVTGEGIIFDFVVVRPLGLVATVGGCAFFIATLPFTVWTKKRIKQSAYHLVGVPGSFTFVRPLGEPYD